MSEIAIFYYWADFCAPCKEQSEILKKFIKQHPDIILEKIRVKASEVKNYDIFPKIIINKSIRLLGTQNIEELEKQIREL
nr:MAG: thioredoxin-like disulfide oxidoreductase [uncultured archaeon]